MKMHLLFSRYQFFHIVNIFLTLGYVFFAIFMPTDNLSLKKIVLFLILIINAPLLINRFIEFRPRMIYLFGVIYPMYTCLCSIVSGGYVYESLSATYFFISLLLVVVIIYYDIQYEKMLVFVLDCLAIVILISAMLDFWGLYDLYDNYLLMYLHRTSNAMVGKSIVYTVYYIIFIKTSPLLLIPLLYYLNNRRYLMAIVILSALVLSGTRANIFMGILATFGFFLLCYENRYVKVIIIIGIIFIGFYWSSEIYNTLVSIFQRKAYSDAIRLGHYLSIREILSNPVNLIWGMGYGVPFYSVGINAMTSHTELSYLEIIRTSGLLGSVPLLFFYVFPLYKMYNIKDKKYKIIAYVCYLTIAATNPLLLSTTAFLMYIYIYSDYYACCSIKDKFIYSLSC